MKLKKVNKIVAYSSDIQTFILNSSREMYISLYIHLNLMYPDQNRHKIIRIYAYNSEKSLHSFDYVNLLTIIFITRMETSKSSKAFFSITDRQTDKSLTE